MIVRFSISVFFILSLMLHSSNINSYTVFSNSSLSIPSPLVVFPCGSKSIVSTFFPASARQADRLIAVVVLPTPPFWLAIAIILPMFFPFYYTLILCTFPVNLCNFGTLYRYNSTFFSNIEYLEHYNIYSFLFL